MMRLSRTCKVLVCCTCSPEVGTVLGSAKGTADAVLISCSQRWQKLQCQAWALLQLQRQAHPLKR
jgi:hypothetical protein